MKNPINYLGKVPPNALDVEEAVLGSLMLEAEAYHKVSGIINAQSFYDANHAKIFAIIKDLATTGKPVDLISVTSALKDKDLLPEIGGPTYITELTNKVASAAHIEYHARIIQQQFLKRELIRIGTETIAEAYEEDIDVEDTLCSVKQKISDIEDSTFIQNTGLSNKNVIRQTIYEIEQDCNQVKKGKQPGITTGFKKLNKATGGWRKTNLIILAARPGVGKTSLALHFAKMAARDRYWVNFYTLEMKASDLMRVIFSAESSVNRLKLRDGLIEADEWQKINNSLANIEDLPIKWYDFAGITASQIKSNTIRNRKAGKCDLIIIDYLQLIKATDKKAIREQQVAEISRTLKEIALSEEIPIICLSQLNREASNGAPQLHHLRESGSLEQDSDIVLFPWREEKDNRFYINIAKNRRGTTGNMLVYVNDEMTHFSDSNIFLNHI